MTEYNIYCDESCHLENDPHKAMVLGAIWCAKDDKEQLFGRLKEIKLKTVVCKYRFVMLIT